MDKKDLEIKVHGEYFYVNMKAFDKLFPALKSVAKTKKEKLIIEQLEFYMLEGDNTLHKNYLIDIPEAKVLNKLWRRINKK